MRCGLPNACSLLCAVGLAVALSLQASSASAQAAWSEAGAAASDSQSAPPASAHKTASKHSAEHNKAWSVADEPYIGGGAPQWRYFVEFRARNAASYGHMYVMYGEVNDRHEIIKSEIAGFFPAGDARDCENCSVYFWIIGHILPVPSKIGASDGDLEEQYVLARFRVWIDADQHQRLIAYINERKAHKGPWNAFLANCVTFGRDVASFLHVKMPLLVALTPSLVIYPKDLVEEIRNANGVVHEQAPLKDAPGSLPVEVATDGQHRNKAAEKATPTPSSAKKRLANQRAKRQIVSSAVH
jgi:uncharacterized iron-regulated membrane protein